MPTPALPDQRAKATPLRVTIVSPLATGAMEQALNCLAEALEEFATVTLVVPQHFVPHASFHGEILRLATPRHRLARALYWYNPIALPGALRLIARSRPDVIHVFNAQGYLLPMVLPRATRVPVVVSVHDPVAHSGAYADRISYTAARYLMLPAARSIHTMSRHGFDLLRAQGFAAEKLCQTRLGALTEVFSRHNRPNVVRGSSLLFFGRWEAYKGIDVLVDAIILLKKRGVVQHCILAGPGSVPEATRAKIAANPECFEVHNRYVSDADVAELFQRANRSVMPYRDATQSCLPAIAQAYGHLMIATRVGSFLEEVESQGGILVEPNSVESLAEGIDRSRLLKADKGEPIDYSWRLVADQLHTLYRRLVPGSAQRGISPEPDTGRPRILLVSLSTILGGAETYYVKLARILLQRFQVVALVHSQELARQMRALGIEVLERPSRSGLRRYLAGLLELWQALRATKPDLVHLNGAHETYLAPLLRLLRVRFCVSRHNPFDTPPLRPRIKVHFLVAQLRAARAVICTQTGIFQEMLTFLPATATVLIPAWVQGTAPPRAAALSPPGPREEQAVFQLLFVGRLIPEKGILTLLRALRGLPSVRLEIVGEGPLEAQCRVEAEGLPVIFHGFKRTVAPYLQTADLLIFPSNEGYEALPQVPMEALAAGTPCLASEIVGVREIYGADSVLPTFAPGDADALRAQIALLQTDPARLAAMSHAGLRIIESRFTEEAVAPQYLEVFAAAMRR